MALLGQGKWSYQWGGRKAFFHCICDFTLYTFLSIQMYYIFYGIFPHDVSPWPVGRTSATTFVVGHLENSAVYVFAVSLGLKGRKSTAVKCKPKSGALLFFLTNKKALITQSKY